MLGSRRRDSHAAAVDVVVCDPKNLQTVALIQDFEVRQVVVDVVFMAYSVPCVVTNHGRGVVQLVYPDSIRGEC
jgi:hypothetical protein